MTKNNDKKNNDNIRKLLEKNENNDHEYFMREAIKEAKKSLLFNEVPIGAIVVKNGKIIGRGHNMVEGSESVTRHAEIIALEEATKSLGAWRLTDCTIYATIEPCSMCAGAIYLSRISEVVYGANDKKSGALGSIYNLYSLEGINHYPKVVAGILAKECSELLTGFFQKRRRKK